ncbi:HipA domain-containing protein [Ferriphaselus sp. R-1]|uniref:HipA domain-containing protein n=1 Tax=Ferriphaselus sp. R-1 TaxID=1485544 RepID=UPI00055822FD|nr:HipA domain-containing protein [Ferriphaselus sp. R-1]
MSSLNTDLLYGILLSSGPHTAAELGARARISQPSVSRAVQALRTSREDWLEFRAGRTIRYAVARPVRGLPLRLPVWRRGERYGELMSVSGGGFLFLPVAGGAQYSAALPWFMQDMRPQGYIGRAYCHAQAAMLGLPEELSRWTEVDVLFALAQPSFDAPGNLELGQVRRAPDCPVVTALSAYFDALAEQSVAGSQPGSSAGGEHPKFAVAYQTPAGEVRPVIVKFSPSLDNPVAERWRDLLLAEHLAGQVLGEAGFPVAEARIVLGETRCHLESLRFDRGELGVATLGAVDDEFIGSRRSWAASATALRQSGLLMPEAERAIATLEAFGRLIGNTDMHFGNVSLFWREVEGRFQFGLAPVYDMLPMLYAPEKGEIVPRPLEIRAPIAAPGDAALALWLAHEFWQRIADDTRVSRSFATLAAENARRVAMCR